jgi:oxygen-independent coproporphyrinogen-3 oxidase
MSINPAPGIYFHIPFCRRKCRYCDFFSITDTDKIPDFIDGLVMEMVLTPSTKDSDSLYIGGGTPSLLEPRQLEVLLTSALNRFNPAPSAEITIEINPGTVTDDRLLQYGELGCNRLNIGIQSFDDRHLQLLGRIHNARQAIDTFNTARRYGFANIGIDLIFGLPGQTSVHWQKELATALDLHPEHISCYMLSYEPGTPMHKDKQSGNVTPLAEKPTADLFRMTHETLCAAGYDHYEISNFSHGKRYRSRHNQKYWGLAPYAGLGPSAHSYDPKSHTRRWNHSDVSQYLNALVEGKLPTSGEEILTKSQQMMEALYLGLRQSDGLNLPAFEKRFNLVFAHYFKSELSRLNDYGWTHIDGDRLCPTLEGMLFLDQMVGILMEPIKI